MSLLAESTRALVVTTRSRLAETRSLVAVNRRRLNPWWALSGGSDDAEGALLQSVLDRLHRRALLPAPGRVWAGMGTGQTCVVCTRTIQADEVENEIAINGGGIAVKLWAHIGCLATWRRASELYAQQHPSSTDGHLV